MIIIVLCDQNVLMFPMSSSIIIIMVALLACIGCYSVIIIPLCDHFLYYDQNFTIIIIANSICYMGRQYYNYSF